MDNYASFSIFDRSMTRLASASYDAIFHNARVKIYPNGGAEILCAERNIFREAGWEGRERERGSEAADGEGVERIARDPEAAGNRAKRRARSAVYDLAMSNEFRWFCTFTLDANKIDRYDIAAITKKLNTWLDNNVRRRGLKYILVPELHKDGAVHFHGLLSDALSVIDSGTIDNGTGKPRKPRSNAERARWLANGGHIVYNMPKWSLGFSTAIELYGDRRAAVGYVTKYITKSAGKIGGRWYYSGGALARPAVICADVPFDNARALGGDVFVIDELACSAVKITIEEGRITDVLRTLGER